MIDFSTFSDAAPFYWPLLTFDNWIPALVLAPLAAVVLAAYVLLRRDLTTGQLEYSNPGSQVNAFSNKLASREALLYVGLPVFLLTAGVAASVSLSTTSQEHRDAAADTFHQVEELAQEKYAIAGLNATSGGANALAHTVDSWSRGGTPLVEVVLPDGTTGDYWVHYADGDISINAPESKPSQVDPEEFSAEAVLKQKNDLFQQLHSTYDVISIAPPTSSDSEDPAAWARTFGITQEDTSPEIRVEFSDGTQSVMRVVTEGNAIALVGQGGVDPMSYLQQ